MKRIFIFVIAAMVSMPAFTQELSKKEQRKLQKELKKEQQAAEAAQKAEVVTAMVEFQRFVLEADMLRDKRGNSVPVVSTINFISADSLSGVIQVGSNAYIGRNGVGGITVEGSISEYKFSRHERSGSYNISYILRTPVGTYDVQISARTDGRADATVRSTTWGNQLNYTGYLVPLGLSRVFKGMSL
jgi:hypothetical protein